MRLLRKPEVRAKTGLSRPTLHRLIAAGKFPRPVSLGEKISAWPESEVEAWCAERIAERDAGVVAPADEIGRKLAEARKRRRAADEVA